MFKQSAVTCLTLLLLIVAVQSLAKSAKDRHHPHKILKNVQKAPGSVFPKPQVQSLSDEQHRLNGHSFSFVYKNGSVECSLLREAFDRIYRIIFKPYEYAASLNKHERVRKSKMPSKHSEPLLNGHFKDGDDVVLNTLEVNIDEACEDYPNLESDESCKYLVTSLECFSIIFICLILLTSASFRLLECWLNFDRAKCKINMGSHQRYNWEFNLTFVSFWIHFWWVS